MTDKELLELAAKAAGIEIVDWYGAQYTARKIGDGLLFSFNPLTDDGDALRLAVELNLRIAIDFDLPNHDYVKVYRGEDAEAVEDRKAQDPYAATRRAIVRAAAEIGKGIYVV